MVPTPTPVVIALAGNAFITKAASNADPGAQVGDNGLTNWNSADTVCSVYFKAETAGEFDVAIKCRLSHGSSQISITNANVPDQTAEVTLSDGEEFVEQDVGSFSVPTPGYVKMDIQGISADSDYFGEISDMILTSHDLGEIHWSSDPSAFGWAIRGPGIDIFYTDYPGNIEYFYNELTIPEGHDSVGAYFMAAGFSGGYFGFQTNSSTRRTVLFSIWSVYNTSDPKQVPADYDVRLIKTLDGNKAEPFGGEGAGGHVNFDYWFKAGITYKFLVRGAPMENGEHATKFSAWFWAPDLGWHLMATYVQPKKRDYLSGFYSFSEGLGNTSYLERKVYLSNQWVRDKDGNWLEINNFVFYGADKYRVDRVCGVEDGKFFLKNCGFFNETLDKGTFTRPLTKQPPNIDFASLQADLA